jgi:hypothetical protein
MRVESIFDSVRPNIDIPWSIHGNIKQYAQTNDTTIEEAYIEVLRTGIDQLPIPDDSNEMLLSKEKDRFPFGPWEISCQGEQSHDINDVTTCFPHLYIPDQPVKTATPWREVSTEKLESMLAAFQANTSISEDWFTIHQLGGAWVGRGLTNFAHAISTAEDLFNQADFPLYKQGLAIYIASLPRENEYMFIRSNISKRKARISDFSVTFLLDGYPLSGREYYEIASRFGFSELINAKEHHLPSMQAYFANPLEVNVVEEITETRDSYDEPWVSGLIIENPFQVDAAWKSELEWQDIPDQDHQRRAENATETLSNYDQIYCKLQDHHPVSDECDYRLDSISATYLSTLIQRHSIWNITPTINW